MASHHVHLEKRALAMGVTLDHAFRFFEMHYRPEHEEISIFQARDRFLGTRKNLRPATVEYYEQSTAHLLKPDPNKWVHNFTVSDIEDVLNRFSNPNTARTYRRGIATFFSWATRHHFCLENPCARLDKDDQDLTKISILNLLEVTRLLAAAMKYADGVMAPSIAITNVFSRKPGM